MLEFIRAVVRPIVTLEVITAFVVIVVRIFWNSTLPLMPVEVLIGFITAFTTTVATIAAFWFAQRSATRSTSDNQPPNRGGPNQGG